MYLEKGFVTLKKLTWTEVIIMAITANIPASACASVVWRNIMLCRSVALWAEELSAAVVKVVGMKAVVLSRGDSFVTSMLKFDMVVIQYGVILASKTNTSRINNIVLFITYYQFQVFKYNNEVKIGVFNGVKGVYFVIISVLLKIIMSTKNKQTCYF